MYCSCFKDFLNLTDLFPDCLLAGSIPTCTKLLEYVGIRGIRMEQEPDLEIVEPQFLENATSRSADKRTPTTDFGTSFPKNPKRRRVSIVVDDETQNPS